MSKARELAELSRTVADSADAVAITVDSNENTTFTGVVTANAGVVVDNITIDGTTLALSSGDLTLDVAGDIILDADGGEVVLKDASVTYGQLKGSTSDFIIQSLVSDKDIIFKGLDGAAIVSALTLDMSAAGAATFNAGATLGGVLSVNSGTGNVVATFTSSDSGAGINLTDNSGTSNIQTNGSALRIGVDEDGAVSSSLIQFRVDGSTKATINDSGVFTSDGGVVVDNITIDGTTIALSSGDLTLDVAGDIILDADGGDVFLRDAGSEFGRFQGSNQDFLIRNDTQDKDILIVGNDGGVTTTALSFDMSAAGAATFNSSVTVASTLLVYGVGSEAASRFTINNDNNNTGHLQFQTAQNDQQNGYVRANMVLGRNKDTLIWDPTDETWDYTTGSSADWSMISKTSGSLNFYIGAHAASNWSLSNNDFNTNYLMYSMTPAGGHTWEAPGGGDFIFNNNGLDRDFRVESDSQSHMLYVDAGNGVIGVKNDSPANAATHLSIGGDTISTTKATVSMVDSNASLHMRGGSPLIYFDVTGGGTGTICTDGTAMYIKDGDIDARGNTTHVFGSANSGTTVINESSQDIDFRVESDSNANMLFVDAGNNSVGIGTSATGTTALVVQAASGAGAISIIGRAAGGIGTVSFYDDDGTTSVGYIQGRADDTEMRMWGTQTGGNLSFATQNTEALKVTSYQGVHSRNGHLGTSYRALNSPDRAEWTVSTFADNAAVTSGTVSIYTSNVEWQPNLLRVVATSVDNDLTDTGNAVWYIRVSAYHGSAGGISTVQSWTSGSMSISVTATDVDQHHMRVNITVTGSGNRTVCAVESLSYGGVFETARTG